MGMAHVSVKPLNEMVPTSKKSSASSDHQTLHVLSPLVFLGQLTAMLPLCLQYDLTLSRLLYRFLLRLATIIYCIGWGSMLRVLSGDYTTSTSKRFLNMADHGHNNKIHEIISLLNYFTTIICTCSLMTVFIGKSRQVGTVMRDIKEIVVVLQNKPLPACHFYCMEAMFVFSCLVKGGLGFMATFFEMPMTFNGLMSSYNISNSNNGSTNNLHNKLNHISIFFFTGDSFIEASKAGVADMIFLLLETFPCAFFVGVCAILAQCFASLADKIEAANTPNNSLAPQFYIIRQHYARIYHITSQFVGVVGFALTVTIIENATYLLFISYYLLFIADTWSLFIYLDVCWLMGISLLRIWVVTAAADAVVSNARKPLNSLCDLKKMSLDNNETLQLSLLIHKLSQCPIEISASGFCTLNRSFFGSVVGMILTYLIVLAQFHREYDKEE